MVELIGTVGEREQLRGLPHFPNEDVLLDTPDVEKLVTTNVSCEVTYRFPLASKTG